MGTIKRLNDQQKQQAQAEAAMPGAYENRYDEGIQNALAGMDSANSAGLGFDSQNGTYRVSGVATMIMPCRKVPIQTIQNVSGKLL